MVSVSLGSTSSARWIAETTPVVECAETQPITVAGAQGESCDGGQIVMVVSDGRGYVIKLYTDGDDPRVSAVYSATRFETVLATVALSPGDAVEATPAPS